MTAGTLGTGVIVVEASVVREALAVSVAAGVPVVLWGSPGTGKTSVVRALGRALGCPVEVVIGSLREPSDFAGLPVVVDGGVRMAPPEWAVRLSVAGGGLLFLDELSTAPPAVQAAMLRVVLERVVGDLALPAAVRVVAAANPPDEAADGWDLAPPLANRLVHLDWPVDAAAVATGLATGFPEPAVTLREPSGSRVPAARAAVAAFLKVRPALVLQIPKVAASAGRGWPSPRSWEHEAILLAACDGVSADVRGCLVTGEAQEWRDVDVIVALTAAQWRTAAVTPATVQQWRDAAIGPSEAVRWHEFAVDLPEARRMTAKGEGPEAVMHNRNAARAMSNPQLDQEIQDGFRRMHDADVPGQYLLVPLPRVPLDHAYLSITTRAASAGKTSAPRGGR